jgi:hypothetical protein
MIINKKKENRVVLESVNIDIANTPIDYNWQ